MLDASTFGLFVGAAVVVIVIPGPAVLYIVARSLEQGRKAGVISTLGVAVGSLVHVAAAALGISALLLSSALAFSLLKYLGAAYLIYLGLRKLLVEETAPEDVPATVPRSLSHVFVQGMIVNVLNPKTALFFLAFLPHFVDTAKGHVTAQLLTLGCVFVVLALASDGIWALAAGSLGGWVRERGPLLRAQRYVSGTVYLGLGVGTALAGDGRR
jgi:threonine/homoserine/homoserine lactone efflux protein